MLQQLRTAARPGQQRPISQLAVATDRLSDASPSAPVPVVDFHARFSQQRAFHCYHPLNSKPMSSSMSLPSVRCFSSDDKDDDKSKNKEKEGKSEEKEEEKKESKEKESVAAVEEGASDATKDDSPVAAADDAKPEAEEDDCPPWMNPLHFKDDSPSKEFIEDLAPGEELEYLEAPPLEDPDNPDKVLASQEVYDLADEIVHLSMLEMKELITKIGDHFGFEKPPFTGSDGSGGGGGGDGDGGDDAEAEAAVVKTQFDVKLAAFDPKSKIKVIKEVRAVAGLGLKEAKDLVEGAPKVVMKDVSKETAEELKEKLEAVGATIEIV